MKRVVVFALSLCAVSCTGSQQLENGEDEVEQGDDSSADPRNLDGGTEPSSEAAAQGVDATTSEEDAAHPSDPTAQAVDAASPRGTPGDAGHAPTTEASAVVAQCAEPASLDVCIDSPLLDRGNGEFTGTFGTSGLVTRVGTGYPEMGVCAVATNSNPTRYLAGFGDETVGSEDSAAAVWLELRDEANVETLVSLTAPGFDVDALLGRSVEVSLDDQPGEFAPTDSQLTVRSVEGGVVFWLGEAGTVEALTSPLQLRMGDALCERQDNCVSSWNEYALDIDASDAPLRDRDALSTASAAYGTSVDVAGWVVVNGAIALQARDATKCDDAFMALARVAAWPTPKRRCETALQDMPCYDFSCAALHADAIALATQRCTEPNTHAGAGVACGLDVVWSASDTEWTYAFFDRGTGERVGAVISNDPAYCGGEIPRDVACFTEGAVDGQVTQLTELCSTVEK